MNRFPIHLILISMLAAGVVLADDNKASDAAKTIGHKTGEAVHEVGKAGKEVGKKVVEVAREVGHATRDGAREFHQAVTGKDRKKASHHASSSTSSHAGAK